MTGVGTDAWVDTNGDNDTDAGEFVEYLLHVVNMGTVTLDSILLTDGSVDENDVTCLPSVPDSLVPGEGFECRASYTVSASTPGIAR